MSAGLGSIPKVHSFAETQGFEPWRAFRPYLVSSEALSTTQPRLLDFISETVQWSTSRPPTTCLTATAVPVFSGPNEIGSSSYFIHPATSPRLKSSLIYHIFAVFPMVKVWNERR